VPTEASSYMSSLGVGPGGWPVVSDNNANKLYTVDFERKEVRPLTLHSLNPLQWPGRTRYDSGFLYVSDQTAIRRFRGEDEDAAIRSFYEVSDVAMDDRGGLFILPGFRAPRIGDPLVVQLASSGRKIAQYGQALLRPGFEALTSLGFIECGSGRVFVTLRHFPQLQIVNRTSLTTKTVAIGHPAFGALASLDGRPEFRAPRPEAVRLSRYVSGLAVHRDRVFVLLDLPYVDIHEYNIEGDLQRVYIWRPGRPIDHFFGIVIVGGREASAVVGVRFGASEYRVLQFAGLTRQ